MPSSTKIGRHLEFVDVGAFVVLGVGDGGIEYLLHDVRGLLVAEIQHRQRLFHRLAAHLVRHQPRLLRGDARAFQSRCNFHFLLPFRRRLR
jgi:hypothetical protein